MMAQMARVNRSDFKNALPWTDLRQTDFQNLATRSRYSSNTHEAALLTGGGRARRQIFIWEVHH
jgi:hypothetical protein